MQVKVQVVNAFVDGAQGGNPAGVVVDADLLSHALRQAIATRVGFSETAFVSRSEQAAFRLEFFTPNRQVAHCGHATVATFSLLRQLGRVSEGWTNKETIEGNRDILIAADQVFMEQRAPAYRDFPADSAEYAEVLAGLGIGAELLVEGMHPTRVDTGVAFMLVALRDEDAVRAIRPDLAAIERLSDSLDLVGFYVFSRQTQQPGRAAGARMFAPRYGIPEEAATGMAAGPLACFLHDRFGIADAHLSIEQGWLMQPASPSLIRVELDLHEGRIQRLMAGGRAAIAETLVIDTADLEASVAP
ncbi:PhzF family phenazine biosynthesis protein [Pseudomonas sp. RIT-PI-AD]|uniref:PhzF family phenazine biosynthesis protein n=1 Tax=Pseudomonas sp. RIT-PI-AD TaxID=3035294 RepID=UPI0021DA5011|nr:PhzF family phenazine biosynthesis protein [Pseudomonas sp. RIT-PI-AD]